MHRNNVLNFARFDEEPDFSRAASEPYLSQVGLDIFRNNKIGLMVALLVSSGLWGALLLAAVYFVSLIWS
jgi:hypothetical protein